MSRFWNWKRQHVRAAVLGAVVAALAPAMCRMPPLQVVEDWLQDHSLVSRGPRPSPSRVAIVAIDEDSLTKTPDLLSANVSTRLAKVVRFLADNGAKAIGIDLVPRGRSDKDAPGDDNPADLAEAVDAVAAKGCRVICIEWADEGRAAIQPPREWWFRDHADPGIPIDLACANLTEDDDFVIRRQGLIFEVLEPIKDAPVVRAHLGLALAAAQQGSPVTPEGGGTLGAKPIPLERGRLAVNYLGPPGTVFSIPIKDILDDDTNEAHRANVKGAVAIIGVTARSQKDVLVTPYAGRLSGAKSDLMSGAEFHASVVSTLLDEAYLWRLPLWVEMPLLALIGAGLALCISRFSLGGFLAAAAFVCVWSWGATLALGRFHLQLPLASAYGAIGLAVFASLVGHLLWLQHLLASVKSRAIASVLEADTPAKSPAATIMFVDLRGFSRFSQDHAAHDVTQILNEYYAAIVPVIERQGGVVNQYMGDGVMVLFGATDEHDKHALDAVIAAIEVLRTVRLLNPRLQKKGYDLRIGIGIATGPVKTGVVGSPNRFDYTAIGHAVNLASRIQGVSKELRQEILLSANTWKELPHEVRTGAGFTGQPLKATVSGIGEVEVYPVTVEPEKAPTPPGASA